ncbi:MAG: RND transporter [Pirellulaceae bacterium]|nr:MAG: RND transporter [Pirellulaceae bacterium]
MKRMILWVFGLLAAFALGGYWLLQSRAVPVFVAQVRREVLASYVDERARTRLEHRHTIRMPFDGRIAPLRWRPGDPVQAGQTVAELLATDRQLELALARATVARWEAALAEASDMALEEDLEQQAARLVEAAEAMADAAAKQQQAQSRWLDYYTRFAARITKLALTSAESETERDLAETQRDAASLELLQREAWLRAQLAMLEASRILPKTIADYAARRRLQKAVVEKQLEEARLALEQALLRDQRAVMTSPVDGVVLSCRPLDEQFVPAGTELMVIGDLEELEVECEVLAASAVAVRPGNEVELYGPAVGRLPDQGWKGRVVRVEPEAFTKTSALGVEEQRARVIIAFDDLDAVRQEVPSLGVGFDLRARIYTSPRSEGLAVPRAALFRDDEGSWAVFVVQGGRAWKRIIQVGRINDQWAEVTSGLDEGDQVVVAPDSQLAEGMRVESTPFVMDRE